MKLNLILIKNCKKNI